MNRKGILFLAGFTVLVGYQNCGDIKVAPPPIEAPSTYLKVGGSFCPSIQRVDAFSLQEFYALNLTARSSRFSGLFQPDSDADGVSDFDETDRFDLDPDNRRTFGTLDSVCVEAGLIGCNPGNSGSALTFGLRTIDLENQFNSGVYGEDQDQDRIPDFVELLFGTLVNSPDSDISSDSPGGESNIDEIKKGLAPRSILDDSLSDKFWVKAIPRLDDSVDCGTVMNGYSFDIAQLPLVETRPFSSEDEPYLNHAANENLILILLVSVKDSGQQEISYVLRRVPLAPGQVGIDVKPEDFKLINNLDP